MDMTHRKRQVAALLASCALLTSSTALGEPEQQNAPVADKRGTAASPAVVRVLPPSSPVVVRVLPPEPPDARGTGDAPVVVRVLPRDPTSVEESDRRERRESEREAVKLDNWLIGVGVFQGLVFALQLVAFVYQGAKLRRTVTAAEEQGRLSARTAMAMEDLAAQMTENAKAVSRAFAMQEKVFKLQLRAYCTVLFGNLIEQDRTANYRYEVVMLLKNTGNTPARAIAYRSRLVLAPLPLPDDFDLTLEDALNPEAATLFPQQPPLTFRTALTEFIPDDDITPMKRGQGRQLYAFGVVTYLDQFDEIHHTRFCQLLTWDVKNIASTLNVARGNVMT